MLMEKTIRTFSLLLFVIGDYDNLPRVAGKLGRLQGFNF